MTLIVAGGRLHHMTDYEFQLLEELCFVLQPDLIIEGGADGVDAEANLWAKAHGYDVRTFNADWDRFGKAAGPMRNKQMALNADACVLFPGGHGTANMLYWAKQYDLMIFDYRT